MRDLFPHLRALLGPQKAKPAQRRAVLRLIATAAEERLPLAALLEAWSYDERGAQRLRLRRLAKTLRNGTALPDALERHPGALDDDETLMVRFASESGTLAPTIRGRLDAADESTAVLEGNIQRFKNYAFLMVMIGVPIAVWFTMVVQPAINEIIRDFGAPTPAFMTLLERLHAISAPIVVVGVALAALAVLSRVGGPLGRFLQRRVAPLFSSTLRRRRGAEVLQRLGESAIAGRPLAGAIATLARHHYDPTLRHKLLFVRNELSLGAELWPTLARTGIVNAREAQALATSDPVGSTGWTLKTLADLRRRHASRRLAWLSSLAVPVIVAAFGAFVLLQALGLMSFMTELTTSLA